MVYLDGVYVSGGSPMVGVGLVGHSCNTCVSMVYRQWPKSCPPGSHKSWDSSGGTFNYCEHVVWLWTESRGVWLPGHPVWGRQGRGGGRTREYESGGRGG